MAIGIDIGGTKTAIGLVNQDGQLIDKHVLKTEGEKPPHEMVALIAKSVDMILNENGCDKGAGLSGIGIGAPGPIDIIKGEVTCPPNLPAWRDTPVVKWMQHYFPNTRIRLENDANAAAVAEKWVGQAQSCDDFVYMTISTGIGGGFYVNSRPVFGYRGNGGEVGHIVVDSSGPLCTCGQRGCFEAIASGTAIQEQGSKLAGRTLTPKEIFERYLEKDPILHPYLTNVFEKIGVGCVTMINLFDPELIVLGGGVTNMGEPLFAAARSYTEKFALNPAGRKTPIVPSGLDQDTGVIGAAALIQAL
ncbi:ROK family protein [Pullulanibacillus sp. KACC 23026]|uniref:ROK family protein n=1 Tax=Pullulanibacillus sp. KACC 23026 TaxID=3028315 RepID=UPI0023AFE652|nr:ROK family protein [Pullulanibacillus sp. KACC 23026]WEG13153.1 ROK family protein [Pullulanibacillus sp. KACC 23026]